VCSEKGKKFQQHAICAIRTLDERPSIFIRDNPIFSSEKMLRYINDYYRKSSVRKKSVVVCLKRPGAKMKCLAVNRQS
jgi:hypothetical protein